MDQPDEYLSSFGFISLPQEIQARILREGTSKAAPYITTSLTPYINTDIMEKECSSEPTRISQKEYERYLFMVNPTVVCQIFNMAYETENVTLGVIGALGNFQYIASIIRYTGQDGVSSEPLVQTTTSDIEAEDDPYGVNWYIIRDEYIISSEFGLLTTYRILSQRYPCINFKSYSPRDIILRKLGDMYEVASNDLSKLVYFRVNALEMDIQLNPIYPKQYELNTNKRDEKMLIESEINELYEEIKKFIEQLPRHMEPLSDTKLIN